MPASLARLLAASDPFARAPEQARLALVFTGVDGHRVPLEIWRRGDELSLVRFLAEKDRGKFVLRRGADVWLLTPGARKPVKMSPALAPSGGAALDQLFALRLERDYRIASAEEAPGTVTYGLEAKDPATEPARVVWVLDRARTLPLRIEFRAADDRVERLVEFKSWKDEKKKVPERIVAKDLLRGGPPLDVEILAVEERELPEAIFEPENRAARDALPPPLVEPED
ncbi:MAG TPA: outer membrane lipoprotein-sorting protein [Thermoanaerobaculia bacterium]|nr:outer membrane lipoprotein-sorting protein [Thermoanaerobaculia bacterium]